MTPSVLVDLVAELLTEALDELQQLGPDGELHRPRIVTGWQGPKRAGGDDDHPVVVVRAVKGQDTEEGGRTTLRILFGAWSEDDAGWRDLVNTLQRSRSALLQNRTLGAFTLELPADWTIYDEQPLPQWQAELFTIWAHPEAQWTGPTQ